MNFNGATSFEYQTNIQQNAPFRFGKPNFANNDFGNLNPLAGQGQIAPSNFNMNNVPINSNNGLNKKRKAESSFTCTICSIEVGSQDVLTSHMNGQKHAKRLRQIAVTKSGAATPMITESQASSANTSITTSQMSVATTPSTTTTTAAAVVSAPATPALSQQNNSTIPKSNPNAKLPLQELNDLANYHQLKVKYEVVSETGPQHAKQFEVKCIVFDPKTNAESEVFKTASTSISKAKQAVAEITLHNTKLPKPTAEELLKRKQAKNQRSPFKSKERKPKNHKNNNSNNNNNNNKDDSTAADNTESNTHQNNPNRTNNANRVSGFQDMETQRYNKLFLLAKHIQIQPDKEQMTVINQLATCIEQSMKQVSDKLMHDELKMQGLPLEGNSNEVLLQARKLRGIFRVGPLEKGLLLKTDRELNMTAITTDIPTLTLVNKILNELQLSSDLFKVTPEHDQLNKKGLKLIRDESSIKTEGCAYITYEYKPTDVDFYRVKLSFTSTKLDRDLAQINVLNGSKDSLPVEKCIECIDELRRTKWFSVKLKPIANAMLILRVMRDFCRRTPTWFVLNDWLLELVVDKCFVRNKYEKVSLKFRTIFEAFSSGMLFMQSLTSMNHDNVTECLELVDPCIKESVKSIFEHVTQQQKEDLTSSAQHALRLIAYKKINQILALDAAEANSLFSSTTSSDKLISKKNESQSKPDVAADLDSKLNLMSQTPTTTTTTTTTGNENAPVESAAAAAAATAAENFNENINNISMFVLNNYASNIFDLCFSFLDLNNLKN